MTPSKRTTIIFPPTIRDYLKRTAAAEGRTVTEVVLESIRLREQLRDCEVYIRLDGEYIRAILI